MLKKLYESGYFDYKKFIIDNGKKIGLTPNEEVILIALLDLGFNDKKSFSVDEIKKNVLLPIEDIQETLSKLMTKKYYKIYTRTDDNGLMCEVMSLDGFFNHAKNYLNNSLSISDSDLYTISSLIQEKLNRILSSSELDIITSLVNDDKYNVSDFTRIIKLLEEKKRRITVKVIAQELAIPSSQKEQKKSNKQLTDFISKIK